MRFVFACLVFLVFSLTAEAGLLFGRNNRTVIINNGAAPGVGYYSPLVGVEYYPPTVSFQRSYVGVSAAPVVVHHHVHHKIKTKYRHRSIRW